MKSDVVLSDLKLEQYLLGELPEAEMQMLRDRETTDEIFRARIALLRKQNEQIREQFPFEALETKLFARMKVSERTKTSEQTETSEQTNKQLFFFPRFMKIAAAIVVAFGVLSAVFLNSKETVEFATQAAGEEVAILSETSEVRLKGMQNRFEVWKKTADSAVLLQNLDKAREGDELQLRYAVTQKCYGILLSMDGNGVLTVHMGNGNAAIPLEPGKMVTLPYAYKLDNAPHFEKFFLLTSKNPFLINENDFDKSLKQNGVESVTLTVQKEEN